ncbi:MAG: PDR/VanB family oxidoreductase [Alphaproteobacteria bacterium]|nr:PDR/VanB family oxidoreductase [Alphaproteobacteria bacterium]
MIPSPFSAILKETTDLSNEIRSFTFEARDATPFATARAGAHVDVHLPGGLQRQYSLWQWDPEGRWGSVAVKREDTGRGGSRAMHDLTPGTELQLVGPRNNFTLEEDGPHSILIAGGIGATPIYAMAARLAALGKSQQVHYLTRSRSHAAFQPAFEALGLGNALECRYDDTHGLIDLNGLFGSVPKDSHVYVCGPEPLLAAVLDTGRAHLPDEQVHFERFSANPSALEGPSDSFEVELAQSGKTLSVPADKSILDVLLENRVSVDYSCTEGVCGACIIDVLDGEIDHRDSVLTPDEQADNELMCVCVSRAKGSKLILDI